ncbi:hypothetical protein ACIBED_16575 [Rhodococcus coprophilus]|uniref:hypothetical protein n=1 Tax=Rhodococcus coprophilus TaxID=38310 RepID=UPI0037989759
MAAFAAGCGGNTTVTVVDDPPLESAFEAVLDQEQERTLGDLAQAADLQREEWDRMYYFRVPLLMSEVNRILDTSGVVWEGLPTVGAEGMIVFMSEGRVVHAVVDRSPALALSGFATADSVVRPDTSGGLEKVGVEAKGR